MFLDIHSHRTLRLKNYFLEEVNKETVTEESEKVVFQVSKEEVHISSKGIKSLFKTELKFIYLFVYL